MDLERGFLRRQSIESWNMTHQCQVLRIVLGFAFSIGLNQIVVRGLTEWMWRYLEHHAKKKPLPHNRNSLTRPLGLVEATLFTAAFLFGAWALIGGWLALKAAVRWRATPQDESGTGTDNLWLIGSGLSVLVAYIGACIARWQWVPLK